MTKEVLSERRRKIRRRFKTRRIFRRYHIKCIQEVVKEHPEYFLDEFAEELLCRTHTSFSLSIINCVLKDELKLSPQVCYEVAKEQKEAERML